MTKHIGQAETLELLVPKVTVMISLPIITFERVWLEPGSILDCRQALATVLDFGSCDCSGACYCHLIAGVPCVGPVGTKRAAAAVILASNIWTQCRATLGRTWLSKSHTTAVVRHSSSTSNGHKIQLRKYGRYL